MSGGVKVKPFELGGVQRHEDLVKIEDVTPGLDTGTPAGRLEPGFSPDMVNMVVRQGGGALHMRSGLSQQQAIGLGYVLAAREAQTVEGDVLTWAASLQQISVQTTFSLSWSTLSYNRGSTLPTDDAFNASPLDDVSGTFVYEPSRDINLVVFAHRDQFPKFFDARASITTYSDFTWLHSVASKAAAVAVFDNRLMWFNVEADGVDLPTRVVWSDRTRPLVYTPAQGGGAEDVMEMRGSGQAMVPTADGLVLFTEREIWMARPRRDAYAFDFQGIFTDFGTPWPRTIQNTSLGPVFLSPSLDPYIVNEMRVSPFGPVQLGRPSRVKQWILDNAIMSGPQNFTLWDRSRRAIRYFVATRASVDGAPDACLTYYFDDGSWTVQRYPFTISNGVHAFNHEAFGTWGSFTFPWEDAGHTSWDDYRVSGSSSADVLFSSDGTPYRELSSAMSDAGSVYTWRWRSQPILQVTDPRRQAQITGVWIMGRTDSAQTINVAVTQSNVTLYDRPLFVPSASSYTALHVPVNTTGRGMNIEEYGSGSRFDLESVYVVTADRGREQ